MDTPKNRPTFLYIYIPTLRHLDMNNDLKDLVAMVFYDTVSKSVFINITGLRNHGHGKDVSDWILETLDIEPFDINEKKPTIH